jgi:hypothetical protein
VIVPGRKDLQTLRLNDLQTGAFSACAKVRDQISHSRVGRDLILLMGLETEIRFTEHAGR